MASLAEDAQKWQRNTVAAVGKWKENTMASGGPCATLQRKYPEITSCNIDGSWKTGVSQVSENQFRGDVEGKAQKWERGFVRGISQG